MSGAFHSLRIIPFGSFLRDCVFSQCPVFTLSVLFQSHLALLQINSTWGSERDTLFCKTWELSKHHARMQSNRHLPNDSAFFEIQSEILGTVSFQMSCIWSVQFLKILFVVSTSPLIFENLNDFKQSKLFYLADSCRQTIIWISFEFLSSSKNSSLPGFC